jgi:3-methyladenine DNA glycosylase/8-oxoguanine DNA glycosylase
VRDQDVLSATFELETAPNLPQTLAHARMGNGDPCLRVVDDSVWRATRTPFGPATERVSLTDRSVIRVDAWGPGAEWLIQHAPALCGALDAPGSFRPDQPLLRHLIKRHPGLRIGRTDAVFETAVFVAMEQRVATHDAWQSWRRFVRALGEPAPGPMPGLWAPPSAERLARTPYDIFHQFGIERRRADLVRRLAAVARRLDECVGLPIDAAYARLKSITGVGPWTSARIGLIALGDPDAVPIGDLHVPHMVTQALAGERRGSDKRMLELLEPYRGHRGRVIRLLMAGAGRTR